MKRLLCFVVVILLMSSVSYGAEGQMGIYIAPKISYGLTQMRGVDHVGTMGDSVDHYIIGNDTDHTIGGAFAIGYDFNKQFNVPIRTELEYSIYSKAKAEKQYATGAFIPGEILKDNQTYRIQTLLLNAYWDINTDTKFTPYLGVSLGMAFVKTGFGRSHHNILNPSDPVFNDPNVEWEEPDTYKDWGKKTVTNFAWGLSAGVGYDITDNWTIDLGYRFLNLGKVKTGISSLTNDDGVLNTGYTKTNHLYQHQFTLGVRYTF